MKSFFPTLALTLVIVSPALSDVTRGISETLLNRFVEMATICMSTYVRDLCPDPGGLTKVGDIVNESTSTGGFILRDDVSREIIAAFRGSESIDNFISDSNWTLTPFDTFPQCEGCEVQGSYYLCWASVADQVQSMLQDQLNQYPGYGIVITGHSLGGSVAALAAAQLSAVFPNITAYTMGEPRSGNQAFASYIDNTFQTSSPDTTKFFRCTHANDGIPDVPSLDDGFIHHGLEYWSVDPVSADNTYVCTGEAVQCCEAQGGEFINAAHLTYFNHTYILGAQCT